MQFNLQLLEQSFREEKLNWLGEILFSEILFFFLQDSMLFHRDSFSEFSHSVNLENMLQPVSKFKQKCNEMNQCVLFFHLCSICLFQISVCPQICQYPMSGYPHILLISNQILSLNSIFKTYFELSRATPGNPSQSVIIL